MTRTKGYSERVIRILSRLVAGFRFARAIIFLTRFFAFLTNVTRTEGYSVRVMNRTEGHLGRVIRMLCQLVGFRPVERAIIKFTKKCILLIKVSIESRLRITEISLLIIKVR